MSGDDQYGDYSRRGEGQDPYRRRATRGTDPHSGRGADEANQTGGGPAGRGDGAAYPRSYGRDYSGRGNDYAAGSANQDYQQAGGGHTGQHGYGTPGYGSAPGYTTGQQGYTTGQQDYAAAQQDYGQAREYRSYRRGEYRPRGEAGRSGSELYGGAGGGGREPRRSRRDVIGVIASSLFAVLAVLALVGVLWLILGRGGDDSGSEATQQNTATSKPKQSTEPSSGSTTGQRSNAAAKAPVVVLNGTSTTGLAKKVTDQIKAEGWQTRTPGNYPKNVVKKTTVFYPNEDMKTAAENLQKTIPDIASVEPSDPTMAKDALTVVLATDWPT